MTCLNPAAYAATIRALMALGLPFEAAVEIAFNARESEIVATA